jgi:hypothetical protein
VKYNAILSQNYIPGFIRYENTWNGKLNFPDYHGKYYWDRNELFISDNMVFCRFTNEHHAGFILTRDQLRIMIASDGFRRIRRDNVRYSKRTNKVHACVTPYTCYGLTKVIPISDLDSVMVHHMSNRYDRRKGRGGVKVRAEIEQLITVALKKEIA